MTNLSKPVRHKRLQQTPEAMLRYQQSSFHELLQHVWKRSSFYRDYYGSCGIREEDLPHLSVSDLPFLSKKTLMENFDRAVTDPRLKKKELEQWIQDNPDPGQNFLNDFIVIHSSGSSGDVGIFVYDRTAWQIASYTLATYLPPLENAPSGKTRIAFYLASHGHFAGVSTAVRMPAGIYDPLILSVLEAPENIVKRLNNFKPDQLGGYSSSVSLLAELELQGRLRIHPRRIFVSGDKLTASMERTIQDAWRVPVWVLYNTSESSCLALRHSGQEEMVIVEDLNLMEVLNEANQPVLPGAEGRVVVTNLYNYTLPILRYELGDYVVLGSRPSDSHYTTIRDIKGRASDSLPVMLEDGTCDTISHSGGAFFVPGVDKVQFISRRPDHVELHYVGTHDLDTSVRKEFQRILKMKGASQTTLEVRRVEHIASDPKTGKFRRVIKLEGSATYQSFGVVPAPSKPEPPAAIDHDLMDSFIEFKMEEIEQSIPARFEQVVLKYPGRIAVKTGDRSLTYNELNVAANRIARSILQAPGKGIKPVTLLFQHDAPAIAASLGVLKTGKIFVPLNPSLPQTRITAVLEDLEARLIVTDSRHCSLAKELCLDGMELINVDALDSSLSDNNVGLSISPDSEAYILYTSGSTGQPKGVVHNHRNVLHFAMEYTNALHICPNDRLSLLYSISVMGGAQDMFSALLNGASLYPFDVKEEGFSRLASWLIQQDITIYHSVPTVFRSLLDVLSVEQKFPSLRLIKLIGEPVSNKDVESFKKHFRPGCIFVNVLSSTETGAVTWYFVDHSTAFTGNMLPVGYAVEDKEVVLLDDAGNKVGLNQIGEITVKSRYLSLGYWRRPDLTQHVFSADPESKDRRVYRTGNVGRILPDGCLEHLGRKDFQVKIRGHRIEMEEIEVRLLDHPSVKAAAVIVGEGPSGQCLATYWVPAGGSPTTVNELRTFLQERLPDYMVPSFFLKVDALPLLANGKVDRQALPSPDRARAEGDPAFVPPRTPAEKIIAEIWAELLRLDTVGVHDNFFDLGGHSLIATQIISKVLDTLHVEMSVRSFIEVPTVAGLAKLIETIRWTGEGKQGPSESIDEREQGEV